MTNDKFSSDTLALLMPSPLPPLSTLHAFEAAVRHMSFKAAAEDLHVTPGAISQQIKLLEDRLGTPLFLRQSRRIELTEAGRVLLVPTQQAFRLLTDAVARVRGADRSKILSVSLLPSFAALWFVPRLGRFRARQPEVDVRISATPRLADINRDECDVVIRYGLGDYPGLHVEHLLTDDLFPVCSPKLLKGPVPLAKPADLAHHTLLHDELRQEWQLWMRAAGIDGIDISRGPSFSLWDLAFQAAIAGQGVALGRSTLVGEYLNSGKLVKPFHISSHSRFGYYLVCLRERAQEPKILAFREWLHDEIAEEFPSP
jgi:LysR family transcriptional regulator, glycine cleavage system transcriptional activator